ncbi:Imm7 family immunity protein [Amycolatopsis nigrescens]|uniref:Imm7 family immunity protein n=1 Tax=Amycolatopsis nigrescens TaxID=381445 RepID=UPI00037C928B|nr:Imm7 family immunity protein [Amycolatopsis nigrescens]
MFEYHGWVTISETPGVDADDALLHRAVERVRRKLAELGDYHLQDLRWMNGRPALHLAGFVNHRGSWGGRILDLYGQVARLAPGSYGLLYVHDDEDAFHGDDFRVYRMARGQVTEHTDPFLTPVSQATEDPYFADG